MIRPTDIAGAQQQWLSSRGSCRSARRVAGVTANLSVSDRAAAVDAHVRSGQTVALGSGPLVSLAVEYMGRLLSTGRLQSVTAVPTSALAAQEAAFHGVPCALSLVEQPDVMIEQPDVVDNDAALSYVCGRSTAPAPDLRRAQELRESAARVLLVADGAVGNGMGLDGGVPVLLAAVGRARGGPGRVGCPGKRPIGRFGPGPPAPHPAPPPPVHAGRGTGVSVERHLASGGRLGAVRACRGARVRSTPPRAPRRTPGSSTVGTRLPAVQRRRGVNVGARGDAGSRRRRRAPVARGTGRRA